MKVRNTLQKHQETITVRSAITDHVTSSTGKRRQDSARTTRWITMQQEGQEVINRDVPRLRLTAATTVAIHSGQFSVRKRQQPLPKLLGKYFACFQYSSFTVNYVSSQSMRLFKNVIFIYYFSTLFYYFYIIIHRSHKLLNMVQFIGPPGICGEYRNMCECSGQCTPYIDLVAGCRESGVALRQHTLETNEK